MIVNDPIPDESPLEIRVERLVFGGDGLGRAPDGTAVFIPGTAPGDLVRVALLERKKTFARARVLDFLEPSPDRRPAPCPHYPTCGGCQLQHLAYPAQLAVKSGFVREAMERIGKFSLSEPVSIIGGPEWAYRGRTQFKLEKKAPEGVKVGFFAAGSHDLCEIDECLLLDPVLNRTLADLKAASGERMPREVGTLDLAVGDAGDRSASRPHWGIPVDPIVRTVGGFRYAFDARCFFQVNTRLAETLVNEVLRTIPPPSADDAALDLYAGVGLFTLPLAQRFGRVFAAEESEDAARFALLNLARNDVHNVTFTRESVESRLKRRRDLPNHIAHVVVDPPRAGLSRHVVERLKSLAPRGMTYVSCDPATLARDLKELCAGPFRLGSIIALDLFPQTFHVETVVRLDREP